MRLDAVAQLFDRVEQLPDLTEAGEREVAVVLA
jgi:hypothetical protein